MTTTKTVKQLRLAFPRAQALKAHLSTPEGSWSLDLSVPGSPFALPLATGLATGVPAVRTTLKADGLADCFSPGFARDGFRELFLLPNAIAGASGILTLEQNKGGGWSAKLADRLLPHVLSKDAVRDGEMPALGMSGLPPSLEACVPVAYRYWLAADAKTAQTMRDALVESGFFDEAMLKVVDGDIRLCVQQLYLYEPEAETPAAAVPEGSPTDSALPVAATPDAAEAALGKMLGAWGGNLHFPMELATNDERDIALREAALDASGLIVLDSDDAPDIIAKALLNAGPQGEWLLASVDTPEARTAFGELGRPFVFKGDVSRTLFVGSISPPLGDVVWVTPPAEPEATPDVAAELAKRVVTIAKVEDGTGEEERYVLGVVLEPELVDAQQDIYDEATIRVAAHKFMTDFRTVGLMHKGAVNDKVKILESYIAPVDMDFDGAPVKKGAWVMAVRVLDDDLWASVKGGELTGFSIGGTALRKPD